MPAGVQDRLDTGRVTLLFATGAVAVERLQKVAFGFTMPHSYKVNPMAIALKLSDELVDDAKATAAAEHRSVPRQIEY